MAIDRIDDHQLSWKTRILFRFLKWRDGVVPAPLYFYAWRPSVLFSFLRLGRAIRGNGALPEREKRLAMYWAAQQIECPL